MSPLLRDDPPPKVLLPWEGHPWSSNVALFSGIVFDDQFIGNEPLLSRLGACRRQARGRRFWAKTPRDWVDKLSLGVEDDGLSRRVVEAGLETGRRDFIASVTATSVYYRLCGQTVDDI